MEAFWEIILKIFDSSFTYYWLAFLAVAGGAYNLYRYSKTKKKKHLILGLILTLFAPGLILLLRLAYNYIFKVEVLCYMPVLEGPMNYHKTTPEFIAYQSEVIKKISHDIPKDVVEKITKKA